MDDTMPYLDVSDGEANDDAENLTLPYDDDDDDFEQGTYLTIHVYIEKGEIWHKCNGDQPPPDGTQLCN